MQEPHKGKAFEFLVESIFAALGDATRLRIVARLCEQGPPVDHAPRRRATLSRQAITKHLQALEEAGLVSGSRAGRERVWELRTARLTEVRRHLERISGQWDLALERLRSLVEKR